MLNWMRQSGGGFRTQNGEEFRYSKAEAKRFNRKKRGLVVLAATALGVLASVGPSPIALPNLKLVDSFTITQPSNQMGCNPPPNDCSIHNVGGSEPAVLINMRNNTVPQGFAGYCLWNAAWPIYNGDTYYDDQSVWDGSFGSPGLAGFGNTPTEQQQSANKVAFILENFYPANGSYPSVNLYGQQSQWTLPSTYPTDMIAGVQGAIWHFIQGYNPTFTRSGETNDYNGVVNDANFAVDTVNGGNYWTPRVVGVTLPGSWNLNSSSSATVTVNTYDPNWGPGPNGPNVVGGIFSDWGGSVVLTIGDPGTGNVRFAGGALTTTVNTTNGVGSTTIYATTTGSSTNSNYTIYAHLQRGELIEGEGMQSTDHSPGTVQHLVNAQMIEHGAGGGDPYYFNLDWNGALGGSGGRSAMYFNSASSTYSGQIVPGATQSVTDTTTNQTASSLSVNPGDSVRWNMGYSNSGTAWTNSGSNITTNTSSNNLNLMNNLSGFDSSSGSNVTWNVGQIGSGGGGPPGTKYLYGTVPGGAAPGMVVCNLPSFVGTGAAAVSPSTSCITVVGTITPGATQGVTDTTTGATGQSSLLVSRGDTVQWGMGYSNSGTACTYPGSNITTDTASNNLGLLNNLSGWNSFSGSTATWNVGQIGSLCGPSGTKYLTGTTPLTAPPDTVICNSPTFQGTGAGSISPTMSCVTLVCTGSFNKTLSIYSVVPSLVLAGKQFSYSATLVASGTTYQAKVASTGESLANTTYWTPLTSTSISNMVELPPGTVKGAYSSATAYNAGDLVYVPSEDAIGNLYLLFQPASDSPGDPFTVVGVTISSVQGVSATNASYTTVSGSTYPTYQINANPGNPPGGFLPGLLPGLAEVITITVQAPLNMPTGQSLTLPNNPPAQGYLRTNNSSDSISGPIGIDCGGVVDPMFISVNAGPGNVSLEH